MTRPGVKVDIAFDSTYSTAAADRTWTDVTEYALTVNGINIVHGRQDENSQPGPNTCALTLNNSDGRFTPDLASSPYYPNVKIGRPLRVCTNLLTHGDYGTFEADATGWNGNNASVARSTAAAHSGSASLAVTASTSASMSANTPGSTSGIPVVPGETYRASAWYLRGPTSRVCDLRVLWLDSAGASISTDSSPDTVNDTLTWQQIEFEVTAPSNAAYARVRPFWTAPVAGEVHYVDDVRLDYDRFTGYVDEWPLEWPGVVSTWATSQVTASSRMARIGLSDKCRSVIEQEILLDSPDAYYTMGEAAGATRANDSSGNGAAPLVSRNDPRAFWTSTPIVFGTATGPGTDELSAAQFVGVAGVSMSKILSREPLTGISAFEFFFSATGTAAVANGAPLFLTTVGQLGVADYVEIDLSDQLRLRVAGVEVATSYTVTDGEVRHVAVIADGSNVSLYVDGVFEGSVAPTALSAHTEIRVGAISSSGALPPGLTVAMSHVALYATAPSAARIADHAAAGLTGFAGGAAVDRLERYAGYAGIPAAEYSFSATAVTPMAHIDTAGKAPVELMQTVAVTDGGVLYDGRDGVVAYVDRGVRYNAAAALTLDTNAGEVEASYSPKYDRSALINNLTATLSDGTYSVTAENADSREEYGEHGPGDLELATTDTDEAHAAAWWRVNTYGEPRARAPQLGVELAKMTPAQHAAVLAVDVSDKITVSNLPSQSDASSKSFFVEGYTETITDSLHRIEFNVSPATGFDVWEVGHATYGQYDAYPIAY